MKVTARGSYWRWLFLGLLISLCFLVLLFRHVDLDQSWKDLAGVHVRLLLVPLLVTFVSTPLRPWRWQEIFPSTMRPGFIPCFGILSVGNMTNNLLPARGGDLLRCFLIQNKHSLSGASTALATLALEKVLDGLALLVIVLLSCCFFSPPQWLWKLGFLSGIVFVGALMMLVLLRYRTVWFLARVRSLFRVIRLVALGEKIAVLSEGFAEGLSAVTSPSHMTKLVLLTILVWVGDAALIWGIALVLDLSLSLPSAVFVSAVLGLGLMIPAAPGFIGTYEFFSVAALRASGIGSESALALAVVMHAWVFLATIILGFIGLILRRSWNSTDF